MQNLPKTTYIKCSKSNQFTVSHFAGKIAYKVDALANQNRDFLSPEVVEVFRLSKDPEIRKCFTNTISKHGKLQFPEDKWLTVSQNEGTKWSEMQNTPADGKSKVPKQSTLKHALHFY